MKNILLTMVLGFGLQIVNAQQTYVPDDNFEQALINLGYDNVLDDYVATSSIDTVQQLLIENLNISDLTGIEDFTVLLSLSCYGNQLINIDLSQNLALDYLNCGENNLTNLDVSNNTVLTELKCYVNILTSLDVSNNPFLTWLDFGGNEISSIDLSQNTDLTDFGCVSNNLTSLNVSNNIGLVEFGCADNNLTSLDVSNNVSLKTLQCQDNQLVSLDVRNGNNTNMTQFYHFVSTNNPNLTCINVDDSTWSANNWTSLQIDLQHYFSNNCNGTTSVTELDEDEKELLSIVNILGEEVEVLKENQIYFYIYEDGSIEKKINIR